MSIKHALLALLADEPAHGYELKKRVDEQLSPLWSLREAQIYNNLRILEREGLIRLEEQVAQAGLPDRKVFNVTEVGTVALDEWTSSPVQSSRQLKDDFYLKLTVLAGVLDQPDRLADLLWQQRTVHLQNLRDLERALVEAEADGDPVTASLLDGAILHAEADLAWLDRIEARLLSSVGTTGGGES